GHRVTILNRGKNPDPWGARVLRLRGDRTTGDLERLVANREFDACIDFVAYEARDAEGAVRALGRHAGHYVFVGTGQVYLVREGCPVPSKEEDARGELIARPEGALDRAEWDYGKGKRDCERVLLDAWEREKFPATLVRIPMVNGELERSRRLETYLVRILDGGPLLLPRGGPEVSRHVYGGEVARFLATILGNRATFGRAFNVAQEETPTVAELVSLLAETVGAKARIVPVSEEALAWSGLVTREFSPYSTRWMSYIDPALARRELGFRHEPLASYLGKIVASYLASPPPAPPPGYASRDAELALARRLS
ncbi:NAD-dependent epimerase/dehydratase family protein, partial [bacterium]|nr:NAD-dependent epimerase/dehydratase family protein [bacterium]